MYLHKLCPKLWEVRYVFLGFSLWDFGADDGPVGGLVSLPLCLAAFYPSCWPKEQVGHRRTKSELKSQCCLKSASKSVSAYMYAWGTSAKAACFNNDHFLFTRIFLW